MNEELMFCAADTTIDMFKSLRWSSRTYFALKLAIKTSGRLKEREASSLRIEMASDEMVHGPFFESDQRKL